VITHVHDEQLLARVLRCYKPHCRYLRSTTVEVTDGVVRTTGELGIEESCYIDATGHLNAVEVNIAYNQLLYLTIATSVARRLHPVFDSWSMADFWARQLPNILITRLEVTFDRPVDPKRFVGEFVLEKAAGRRIRPDAGPLISVHTSFRFRDDNGGDARGRARVAIVS
jgi:hypothetical protein